MSYSIQVYPIELQEKTKADNLSFDEIFDYMDDHKNLPELSAEQTLLLESHLLHRGFKLKKKSFHRKDFTHTKYPSISAMLTPTGLYFSGRGDDVMDMTITAGEFTYYGNLKGHFAVFDSGNKGWQE